MSPRRAVAVAALTAVLAVACGASDPPAAPGATTPPTSPASTAPSAPGTAVVPTVPPLHPSIDDYPEALVRLGDAGAGAGVTIAVKLAATPAERQHGLMEVPDLPDGTGMLFVFADERSGGFFMKDTLVPLDIAFVRADGTIESILAMDPCTAEPCTIYDPGHRYLLALETPQGWFERAGVAVGDRLTYDPVA